MKLIRLVVISGVMLLCTLMAYSADLILVRDGKPNAVIITTTEAHAQQAAGEIQKYIEKMSGAKLPLLNEADADNTGLPVRIAVGHTGIAGKNGVKIPAGFKEVVGDPMAFEEEGFVIKTKGQQIILGGNSDGPYQGTIYAGYEFLERLGCRFFFPGEWGEVIPEKKTITFPETDLLSKPDFALRYISPGGWIPVSADEWKGYENWSRKVKYSAWGSNKFYPQAATGSSPTWCRRGNSRKRTPTCTP